MEKAKNDSWLARVSIKNAIDGRAQIYIDGNLVHGVIGYKIEQDSAEKRVPINPLPMFPAPYMTAVFITKLPFRFFSSLFPFS